MQDIVIVGAGIAGLAAAWELTRRGVTPLVVEQQNRAGGVILTERVGDYLIDAGPDALLRQKPAAIELCREVGIADRLIPTLPPRTAFVLRDNRLIALPEASFLGFPTRLRSFLASPLFSWRGKLRMAMEPLVSPRRDGNDESIGDFVRRRFGRDAAEYLAEPLLAGIHAGDVDRLSIHALFPRLVQAERTHGSVLRSLVTEERPRQREAAFVSFPNGIRELVDALVEKLGEAAIIYNERVAQISGSGPYTVRFESGNAIETGAVIVATPAWSAGSILEAADRELASSCADIPYVSTATVFFALPRHQVRHQLAGTGFVVPRREGRPLMAATWVSSKWPNRAPADQVLMRGFLGARDHDVVAANDADLTRVAWTDLKDVLGISGEASFSRVYRWPQASVQYNVGHLERVRVIDARLTRIPGLFLTGSGYRGTGIPDSIADARATAANAAAFVR